MQLNKILEYVAYAVGGVALFLASLLVFALAAGVPAHQVAIVGSLFPEPDAPKLAEPVEGQDSTGPARPKLKTKTMEEVIQGTLSRLPTQTHASPFEGSELQTLVTDVKRLKLQYERDLESVAKRERDVEDEALALEDRAKVLDDIIDQLDLREAEIALRQAELKRDEDAAAEADSERWRVAARPFAEGDLDKLVPKLEAYGPEDGARILFNLEEERRNELLSELNGDLFKEFNDAFSALGL